MSTRERLVEIAVPVNGLTNTLTYKIDEATPHASLRGFLARITVGKRELFGVIVRDHDVTAPPNVSIKSITELILPGPHLSEQQLKLAAFVADYYVSSMNETMRLFFPKEALPKKTTRKPKAPPEKTQPAPKETVLNSEQQQALDTILAHPGRAFLLEGVTGSGKTEVYVAAARAALLLGKSVLVIVPEIALTPQLADRFQRGLSEEVAMLHSGLKMSERRRVFEKLQSGAARVIIGARSAIFAKIEHLGLIVVDEEHDPSLKQDESVRYHARDVALWRGHNEEATVILGTATPSLESLYNAQKGRLLHLRLTERMNTSGKMPTVELIDLKARSAHAPTKRGDKAQSDGQGLCILSSKLQSAMADALAQGEQVVLFLNRRGYASFVLCEACGEIAYCPNCSVGLTFHKGAHMLRCHQCDHLEPYQGQCPHCHKEGRVALGLGTERVEQEVRLCFPNARIARLDREAIQRTDALHELIDQVNANETQVLIGTQMVAKGHDFQNVSLVGVILADTGLAWPDFRAAERTFQLLTQVAGRAGRAKTQGRVMIQTFNPSHIALQCAQQHDVERFTKAEIAQRKEHQLPPFVRSALLRIEAADAPEAQSLAEACERTLVALMQRHHLTDQVQLLGPAPAPIEKLRKHFRWQIYIMSPTLKARAILLHGLKSNTERMRQFRHPRSRLIVDVDPLNLL